ncbi:MULTISPECIES: hypothetical protein [Enterobacteriaceae]|jgi:hypothetical protein|uniref:Uncharacterized protein n=2 Tax=Enterobacteriaceae TaxID=543 RepID=A0ABW1Q8H3_9ENTR|nr:MULTISPECIES: hypothetical protein [Phytobacter]MDU4155201.1 hypothetical protein [Enterobacteriaceae bacterium]PXW60901.1 hypothetical protein DFO55_102314 [Grimontella sp. AG753]MDV2902743.1 hypothetical protein [Phytobacter diazotrophicus]BBE78320.1 hypothetical protein MRY16398_33760 [Phytobacter sp. MRY16-398]BDD51692.1 hypothetical protein PDTA9734_31790 [Phytobacter diazotrophicus]
MKNIISELWNQELLPIKDALYLSDGRAFSYKIASYPTPRVEKGESFDFVDFYNKNKDEVTSIDTIMNIKLSNGCYCCVGEGSYGSEGFIACLDKNKVLKWVIYSETSNPFFNIYEYEDDTILAESTANVKIKVNVNNPTNLDLMK